MTFTTSQTLGDSVVLSLMANIAQQLKTLLSSGIPEAGSSLLTTSDSVPIDVDKGNALFSFISQLPPFSSFSFGLSGN